MSLFEQYATDAEKEVNGIPVKFAPNKDGTIPTFYIARMGGANKEFTKARERIGRPFRQQYRLNTMSDEDHEKVSMQSFVEGCIKGWDNVQGADGKVIKFSIENAMKLLTALRDLYDELALQANSIDNYKSAMAEEDAKNSPKS